MKSMALYDERMAFYEAKTTCFAVVETSLIDRASRAYRLKVACLSHADAIGTDGK